MPPKATAAANNEAVISDAVRQVLSQVPIEDRPAPKDRARMNEGNGVGEYKALRVEVESVRDQYHDLKEDMNGRFASLTSEIRTVGRDINAFISAQSKSGGESFFKIAGLFTSGISIALIIGGAFGNMTISKVTDSVANERESRISGDAVTRERDHVTNEKLDRLVTVVDKLGDITMPRPEILALVNQGVREREDLRNVKADKSSLTEMDRRITEHFAAVDKDVSRLQDEADDIRDKQVSRAELEQHWKEAQDRLNINAERIANLQKETSGGNIGDRLKTLQSQLDNLQQKFIAVPSFPKYTDTPQR